MKFARAFSPGHITGFFQIHDKTTNQLRKGSRGAGVSLSRGVTTSVIVTPASKTVTQIKINGQTTNAAPVSQEVVKAFLPLVTQGAYLINIEHEVELPIGCGFGTSGAAALSLALALNKAFELRLSRIKVAQIAHVVEVQCKTGLGTVIAETYGGIEIRLKPGAPGIGEVQLLPNSANYNVVCLPFGPISTPKVLADEETRRRINAIGGILTDALRKQPTVANFMTYSRRFAEHTQLLTKRVQEVLHHTDKCGLTFSTAIFGENVFTLVPQSRIGEATDILSKFWSTENDLLVMNVDCEGARLFNGQNRD